jgi:hypothetical protein
MQSMNANRQMRPDDYLYTLRSEEAYGWWTGILRDGRQVLVSIEAVFFDHEGNLLAVDATGSVRLPTSETPSWRDILGFKEGPIRIKRFRLPEQQITIEDITDTMSEFLDDPCPESWSEEERQEYPELIREWLQDGQYVFYSGAGDYYMSRDGEVETS